jgi:uncharacterized phage protein (TIGR02218 family)
MSYDASEQSVQDGAPVELYTFARNSFEWLYTSAEADVAVGSDVYTSAPLHRSAIETTSEQARNNLTLQCARDFAIAELFRVAPPTDVISVTVKRFHRDDGEVAVIWKGRVLNASWNGAQAELHCEPISTSLNRIGLQRLCQNSCPHVLYGPGCNVDKASFQTDTTVTAVDGVDLTVTALGAYPYAGGFVEMTDGDGNLERRFIRSFSGLVLTLSRPFAAIAVTDAVSVYPGCDHTMATCDGTFSNILNYGGTPFIPRQNPFGGDPIF